MRSWERRPCFHIHRSGRPSTGWLKQTACLRPVYRDGDTVIVSPAASVRPGDRVVVKTGNGEVLARRLHRETGRKLELACLNPQLPMLTIERTDIKWMARIVWTSQ